MPIIEYFRNGFRNGFGASGACACLAPDSELTAHIPDDLFALARDCGALGVQVELHPLFNLFGNLWNLERQQPLPAAARV